MNLFFSLISWRNIVIYCTTSTNPSTSPTSLLSVFLRLSSLIFVVLIWWELMQFKNRMTKGWKSLSEESRPSKKKEKKKQVFVGNSNNTQFKKMKKFNHLWIWTHDFLFLRQVLIFTKENLSYIRPDFITFEVISYSNF